MTSDSSDGTATARMSIASGEPHILLVSAGEVGRSPIHFRSVQVNLPAIPGGEVYKCAIDVSAGMADVLASIEGFSNAGEATLHVFVEPSSDASWAHQFPLGARHQARLMIPEGSARFYLTLDVEGNALKHRLVRRHDRAERIFFAPGPHECEFISEGSTARLLVSAEKMQTLEEFSFGLDSDRMSPLKRIHYGFCVDTVIANSFSRVLFRLADGREFEVAVESLVPNHEGDIVVNPPARHHGSISVKLENGGSSDWRIGLREFGSQRFASAETGVQATCQLGVWSFPSLPEGVYQLEWWHPKSRRMRANFAAVVKVHVGSITEVLATEPGCSQQDLVLVGAMTIGDDLGLTLGNNHCRKTGLRDYSVEFYGDCPDVALVSSRHIVGSFRCQVVKQQEHLEVILPREFEVRRVNVGFRYPNELITYLSPLRTGRSKTIWSTVKLNDGSSVFYCSPDFSGAISMHRDGAMEGLFQIRAGREDLVAEFDSSWLVVDRHENAVPCEVVAVFWCAESMARRPLTRIDGGRSRIAVPNGVTLEFHSDEQVRTHDMGNSDAYIDLR